MVRPQEFGKVRTFRPIVDNFSGESPAIEVGGRLTGDDVVKVLERVTAERGNPWMKTTRAAKDASSSP